MPDDLLIISPEDDNFLDCPVLTKTRTVLGTRGICNIVRWQLRNRGGETVDVSAYIADSDDESSSSSQSENGQVIVRANDLSTLDSTIHQIIGESSDPSEGIIEFTLSEAIVADPGVYTLEIGITDSDGNLVFTEKGFLSIERGLFGDLSSVTAQQGGPPTIGEIRLELRDSQIENDLLDDVEFSDSEIIHAIFQPIRQWNETPPPVAYATAKDFPFREAWLKAIVARLLRIAAIWYERNRLPARHGGITVDDRNKMNPYLQLSRILEQEWKEFIIIKKVSINASYAYGSIDSPYSD